MAIPPNSNWNDEEYIDAVNSDATVNVPPKKVTSGYMQIVDKDGNPVHQQPEVKMTISPPSADGNSVTYISADSGLKDGGTRQTYGSGAQKEDSSKTAGKGAFHLVPFMPILRAAEIWRKGAIKYAARNWEKGIALSRFVDSGLRHFMQAGLEGKIDEDHIHQGLWNFMALSWTIDRINRGLLPATLNDLPGAGKEGQPGYRKDGPAIAIAEEAKGLPEEEVFGRTLSPEERYIPFMENDIVYMKQLGLIDA